MPLAALPAGVTVDGRNIRIEFDAGLRSRVIAKWGDKEIRIGELTALEFLTVSGAGRGGFTMTGQKRELARGQLGQGRRWVIRGSSQSLKKTVSVI